MSAISAGDFSAQSTANTGAGSGPRLIAERPFSTLRRALTVPDEELSAKEAASTLFRFFRSKHVVDLKLIFVVTATVLLFHVTMPLLLSPVGGAAKVVHYMIASAATATTQEPSVIDAVLYFIGTQCTAFAGFLVTYLGPAFPVYTAILAWAYLAASKRLGVVDLFACEIITLCRVGTILDIAKNYVEQCERNDAKFPALTSEEEYFPVFSNNSGDLEQLEALVVRNITEFYTYMKAFRDTRRLLAAPESTQQTSAAVANLIYMLFLANASARKAVEYLIEFQPSRAENIMSILLSELPCYWFLCEHYHSDQLRLARLTLRFPEYNDEIRRLVDEVAPRGEDDPYWGPAKRALPELQKRFQIMLDKVQPLLTK
ncbi:MAG TPA: hypothetical protein VEF90_05735 [Xanthobacteraceae bacterium]|nr:hypothetical protein [Xanthobacteraceae bacterium]